MCNISKSLKSVLLAITVSVAVLGSQSQAAGLILGLDGATTACFQEVQFRAGRSSSPTGNRGGLQVPTTTASMCTKTCAPGMDSNGNSCSNCVVVCDNGNGQATVHQWCLAAPSSGGN